MTGYFNIAGIGVSPHMEEHLIPSLKLVDGLQLKKLASRSSSRRDELMRRYGIPVLEDWKALVTDAEVDAIIVAGPPELNYDVAKECIRLGKSVFSEKPICSDLRAILELAKLEREKKSIVQIGYNFRFSTVWENINSLSSHHGAVRELSIDFHTNKPRDILWNYTTTLESFLYAIAIHPLDMMSSKLGNEETLDYWRTSTRSGGESLIILAKDKDITICLRTSNLSPSFIFRIKAIFEDGTVAHTDNSDVGAISWGSSLLIDNGCKNPSKLWKKVQFRSNMRDLNRDREGSGYQAELIEFLEALRGTKSSAASVSASIRTYRWITGIIRAFS